MQFNILKIFSKNEKNIPNQKRTENSVQTIPIIIQDSIIYFLRGRPHIYRVTGLIGLIGEGNTLACGQLAGKSRTRVVPGISDLGNFAVFHTRHHDIQPQFWFKVRPPSVTLDQHWCDKIPMSHVRWDVDHVDSMPRWIAKTNVY